MEWPATYRRESDGVILTAVDFSMGASWLQSQMGLVTVASASDLELTDHEKEIQPLGSSTSSPIVWGS